MERYGNGLFGMLRFYYYMGDEGDNKGRIDIW